MVANSVIDLVSLDFDASKSSLIAFLSGQARFKDYDYTGADINVLLDILTVNTFRNGFYLNQAISEGFIDSAQLRDNVLSHAKELNYCPRSSRSSSANVTVTFNATGENQPYILQKGQSFSTQIKNSSFTFSIPENIIVSSANQTFSFSTNIFEGPYVKDSYIFNSQVPGPITFPILNESVDTTSIVVNVYENGSSVGENFVFALSLLDLDNNSKVYFLQTSAVDGTYEILFGDGVLGYQPVDGSLIVIDYRISSGSRSNGAGYFVCNFDPTGVNGELTSPIQVVTNNNAQGGAENESIETTRFQAPRWFQAQERAIVPSDYEILLKTQFPEINAVNAYGGQTLSPPQFGKVVVAVDISGIQGLPNSLQAEYINFLKTRCAMTITPILVTALHTYINVTTNIKYNINITNVSAPTLQTEILNAITSFNTTFLNDFNTTFYYSPFLASISAADTSIVSNLTEVSVYQKLLPTTTSPNSYILNFNLPLVNNLSPVANTFPISSDTCLTSSVFTYKGAISNLVDDNNGNVVIVSPNGNAYTIVQVIGSINYATGAVQINNFQPDSFSGPSLLIYVQPLQNDISCNQNVILSIEPSQVEINILPIST